MGRSGVWARKKIIGFHRNRRIAAAYWERWWATPWNTGDGAFKKKARE
jgi:hypothetical protein